MTVTVYSQPGCQPCKATTRRLTAAGVVFSVVDVTQDREAGEFVRSLGYLQTPVVVAGDEHWSGYRPARLDALI